MTRTQLCIHPIVPACETNIACKNHGLKKPSPPHSTQRRPICPAPLHGTQVTSEPRKPDMRFVPLHIGHGLKPLPLQLSQPITFPLYFRASRRSDILPLLFGSDPKPRATRNTLPAAAMLHMKSGALGIGAPRMHFCIMKP